MRGHSTNRCPLERPLNTSIPVGLIGLGRHGSRYLRHLVQDETGGKLIGISRQNVDQGREQAAEHGIQFFPDYRDLIANPAIQAVLVLAPAALHAQITLEAIKYQKPIFIEKPLTVNVTEGTYIVEAAHQADVHLMTGHTLRYEPVIQKIQEMGAALGPWQSLNATMHLEQRPEMKEGQEPSHGILLEFGIHLLDWVRMMMPNTALTVSANMTRLSPNTPESRAKITLTTPSGLTCQLDVARVTTQRVTYIEILGKEKRIRGDWTNEVIETYEKNQRTAQEFVQSTSTIVLMLQDFFQALKTGQAMPITGEEGCRAVELAEACHQAAQSGQSIRLPAAATRG